MGRKIQGIDTSQLYLRCSYSYCRSLLYLYSSTLKYKKCKRDIPFRYAPLHFLLFRIARRTLFPSGIITGISSCDLLLFSCSCVEGSITLIFPSPPSTTFYYIYILYSFLAKRKSLTVPSQALEGSEELFKGKTSHFLLLLHIFEKSRLFYMSIYLHH